MSVEEIRAVVDVWSEQYVELGVRDDVGYVQVFENRGAMMGGKQPASARTDMGKSGGSERGRCRI
jgi:galactose-1-phosphate uridylyltransferase